MTSPYSSNLLQQTVDTTEHAAPRPVQHSTHVTRVVAAPQPVQYAPQQPQVVYAQPAGRAGRVGGASALVLGLVVILLGAVALVGAYFAAKNASPSLGEASLTQGVAMREGFRAGRDRGVQSGLEQSVSNAATISRLRIAAAREQAFNAAYRRGMNAGSRYRAPSYGGGYRGGYRAPRYGGYSGGDVVAAFGQAQNLANATGAPVDIEVY
ncbi:MAG: hypothetical protein JWL76_1629 [Thermoleophilia bacterium]|nr:hypothetical protein [Thermoleophilia bacterium]